MIFSARGKRVCSYHSLFLAETIAEFTIMSSVLGEVGKGRLYSLHAWEVVDEENEGFITEEYYNEVGVMKVGIYVHYKSVSRHQAFTICSTDEINLDAGGRTIAEMVVEGSKAPVLELVIKEGQQRRWWLIYMKAQQGVERELLDVLKTRRFPFYEATFDELAFLQRRDD
jgi:hypothetical protein